MIDLAITTAEVNCLSMASVGFADLADQMIKETSCDVCDEPFSVAQSQQDLSDDQNRIEFDYECPECDTSYEAAVFESNNDSLRLLYDRQDIETHPKRSATGICNAHKSGLYEQTLPIRGVADGLNQLYSALRNLTINKQRHC